MSKLFENSKLLLTRPWNVIGGFAVLFLSLFSLLIAVVLVGRSQHRDSEAVDTGADIFVKLSSDSIEFGEDLTAEVQMWTQKNIIGAASVEVGVDPTMFEIIDIVAGDLFGEDTATYGKLSPNILSKAIDNTKGTATLQQGVPCTPCYIKTNPNDGTTKCGTAGFQCFPVNAGAKGIYALVTLRPKGKTGLTSVNVNGAKTEIAVTGQDLSVPDVTPPASLIKNEISIIVSCEAADYTNDSKIAVDDIAKIKAMWNLSSGSSVYSLDYDFNADGIINAADIQQVANKIGTTCN